MNEKLTKIQADNFWKQFEKITDRMIRENKNLDDGDYKSGGEDAIIELRTGVENLLEDLEIK